MHMIIYDFRSNGRVIYDTLRAQRSELQPLAASADGSENSGTGASGSSRNSFRSALDAERHYQSPNDRSARTMCKLPRSLTKSGIVVSQIPDLSTRCTDERTDEHCVGARNIDRVHIEVALQWRQETKSLDTLNSVCYVGTHKKHEELIEIFK